MPCVWGSVVGAVVVVVAVVSVVSVDVVASCGCPNSIFA